MSGTSTARVGGRAAASASARSMYLLGAWLAVLVLLGRGWFGQAAALVAAVAAALSPFAIHYSQETRMYILVTLFGALAWLALDAWLARPRRLFLALYWLASLAALYTHYFAVALVVA